MSPTSQGFHWNSNAETYYLIGEAMGIAMKTLCEGKRAATTGANEPTRKVEFVGYLLAPYEKVLSAE